jgi:hypothetical protein
MINIEIIKTSYEGIETEHVIIDHGNAEFTSMSKAEYDRREAEQSTPMVADE